MDVVHGLRRRNYARASVPEVEFHLWKDDDLPCPFWSAPPGGIGATTHLPVGRIKACDIKTGRDDRSPAYAFVEMEDPRDAEDAIRGRDGYDFGGSRIRCEAAKGGYVSTSSRGPPRRGEFRVRVTGLPTSASWQVRNSPRERGEGV